MAQIKAHNRYIAAAFINGEQYTNRYMNLSAHASKIAATRELTHELMETQPVSVKRFEFRIYDRLNGETFIYSPADENGRRTLRKTYNFASMTPTK